MRRLRGSVSITTICSDLATVPFRDRGLLVRRQWHEERTWLDKSFSDARPDIETIEITGVEDDRFALTIRREEKEFWFRSDRSSAQFADLISGASVYVDITGLPHSVWAWVIRTALCSPSCEIYGVYREPRSYEFSNAPFEGDIFELTERRKDIAPLPGFASLRDVDPSRILFVPMLGFEGQRLSFAVEAIQPERNKTIPIIGVPGFRPDFPFHTYHGNNLALIRDDLWQRQRFAKANCPADAFFVLEELLSQQDSDVRIIVAPIGPRPHALGALLFKLCHPKRVDIVYDHPESKPGYTQGKSNVLLFDLNLFASEVQANA